MFCYRSPAFHQLVWRQQARRDGRVVLCSAFHLGGGGYTGGLRRLPNGTPFNDVITSTRTPSKEKRIADHPSLKPQAFLRQIVYASLPLGKGIVVDPFMGSGTTISVANRMRRHSIGIDIVPEYYEMVKQQVEPTKLYLLDPEVKYEEVKSRRRYTIR